MTAQRLLEQPFRVDQQILVHRPRQIGAPRQQFGERLTAALGEPGRRDLRTDEADVLPGRRGRPSSYTVTGRRPTYGCQNSRSKVRWLSTSQSSGSA